MANSDEEIFRKLLKSTENEFASVAADGVDADISGWIDTGSYALNALLSGSIYKGMPNSRVTALSGEYSTGKTFFAISIMKQFLIDNPKGYAYYFDTETAVSKEMLEFRGLDSKRVAIIPIGSVEEVRTQAVRILDGYNAIKKPDKAKMMIILDSMGNLSTEKEIVDISTGNDKRDMTRAALLKGMFRVLTLKLGVAQCPMIITNHVYEQVGAKYPTKVQSGGSGLNYAASTIVFLSKRVERDKDKNAIGSVVTATLKKARLTVENRRIETLLNYRFGLCRYYGLLPLAEKFGIVKKGEKQYEWPNGKKAYESVIDKNPENFFTKEILDQIDAGCKEEFLYGTTNLTDVEETK
jgi:RecA/RadA recombinase